MAATVRSAGQDASARSTLIRQILDDDRKIRDLTQPWMARLSALINNNERRTPHRARLRRLTPRRPLPD